MTDAPTRPAMWHRLAALALTIAVLAVAADFLFLSPLSAIETTRSELDDAHQLLDRYRRIAAQAPALEAQLEEARAFAASAPYFLAPDTEAVMAAKLQADIMRLSQTTGSRVRRAQVLPGAAEEGLRKIGLRLVMVADQNALTQFLLAVGNSQPSLFVENMEIVSRAAADPNSVEANNPELQIQLDLFGYAMGGAS